MSNGQIYMCKESAMVPHEDDDGSEVPTLLTKGKTTVREGHILLDKFPELFEPLKVDFEVDDGQPVAGGNESSRSVRRGATKRAAKKAAAKAVAKKAAESPEGHPALPTTDTKPTDTPPAGHVPQPDPAGEGGPEGGVKSGTEAPALNDDPKLG
jgi:hypothetical protein